MLLLVQFTVLCLGVLALRGEEAQVAPLLSRGRGASGGTIRGGDTTGCCDLALDVGGMGRECARLEKRLKKECFGGGCSCCGDCWSDSPMLETDT